MVQTTLEARQQLLDMLGDAADSIGAALASLEAAYEQLDEYHAGELEEETLAPALSGQR